MKTPTFQTLLLTTLLCSPLTLPLAAQGPGRGGRGGGGGHGPGGGGPGGFQEAIHTLFDNHSKIKRTVEMTDRGYKSRTVSDDPEIAKTLQKHVREMRERLGSGLMIRRWDPAFAELVEHYKDIDHNFKEVDGGVEMIASGKTPEAIKVTQNHARIVSGFVDKGPAQMHEQHARALGDAAPKETSQDADKKDTSKATTPGCQKCATATPPEPKTAGCPKCAQKKTDTHCPEKPEATKQSADTKADCCKSKKIPDSKADEQAKPAQ